MQNKYMNNVVNENFDDFLKKIPMLKGCTRLERKVINDTLKCITLEKDKILFNQDEHGHSIYIVKSDSVESTNQIKFIIDQMVTPNLREMFPPIEVIEEDVVQEVMLNKKNTLLISSDTIRISPSLKPLVVRAGVPNLRPLVTLAPLLSKGILFLLATIPASPKALSASRPVMFFPDKSINIRWLSVPPDTRSKPKPRSSSARTLAFVTTCL